MEHITLTREISYNEATFGYSHPVGSYPYVGNHPVRKVVCNVSLTLTEIVSGIALEVSQVIFSSLARVAIDDRIALDLLIRGQERVCTTLMQS